MRVAKPKETPAPKHLSKAKEFWSELCSDYAFDAHDLERLRVACEQIDIVDGCEAAIQANGLFILDRYGCTKAHPAIATARDARQLLLRAIRELAVDVEVPEARVPRQGRRYG